MLHQIQQQYRLKLIIAKWFQTNGSYIFDSERIITVSMVIVIGIFGIFGGLAGRPILSLANYYAPREGRLWIFTIPEFMGFGCLILMVIWGKSKKKKIENINLREMTTHSMIKTHKFDSKIGVCPRSDIVEETA